jgi:hypothetical protein
MKTSFGDVTVDVPRDRKGEFNPQLVKKNQTTISGDIEEKIISMYAKGMTTADIETHIRDIYGLEVSDSTSLFRTPITTIQNKLGRIYSDILSSITTLSGSIQLLAG